MIARSQGDAFDPKSLSAINGNYFSSPGSNSIHSITKNGYESEVQPGGYTQIKAGSVSYSLYDPVESVVEYYTITAHTVGDLSQNTFATRGLGFIGGGMATSELSTSEYFSADCENGTCLGIQFEYDNLDTVFGSDWSKAVTGPFIDPMKND